MLRNYARVAGVLLILLGVAGFLSGGVPLFDTLNTDPWENAIHLAAGAALACAGFLVRSERLVRLVVFVQGAFFAALGCVGFFYPTLFGLLPGGLSIADDVLHVVLGALSITALELSGRKGPPVIPGRPAAPPGPKQPHL
jgi:hypothetical protein